ncbi:MAG TPA: GTPase ObgE [Bacillota bacterium]|nr:GTPase ObgE [Bacillota bacterium]HOR85244.1 GTPase ObgE [Bacillota bacterium]HPL52914.1 GTPase ObgE [Bacillota bacterium]
MFIDKAKIYVKAGDGGEGRISFRREKYVPNGGPDGGDGGDGGDIIFIVDENMRTLMDFRYKRKHIAGNGEIGGSNRSSGKSADNLYIKVPAGTVLRDAETGALLGDLKNPGDNVTAAKGGNGGKGNQHYATPTRQAPRFAQPGKKGTERWVDMELKLLADVGLVGFPNVGKSTLLSIITSAKPKIADYHFTTLTPNLGVADLGNGRSFVIADIPGLIEGAHSGTGLGHDFLRHIERTKILIHLLDASGFEGRDPLEDFNKINEELSLYSEKLSNKPQIIACNKMDIPEAKENYSRLAEELGSKGYDVLPISAATGEGIKPLMDKVSSLLEKAKDVEEPVEEIADLVYHNNTTHKLFTIRKENGAFIVEGELVEQLLSSVNLNDSDSVKYFQKILRKKGIIDELIQLGVTDGDTVKMQDWEFEYFE